MHDERPAIRGRFQIGREARLGGRAGTRGAVVDLGTSAPLAQAAPVRGHSPKWSDSVV